MSEYERSTTVEADADTVFRYLSDVQNLPRYFARMTEAEPTGDDEVHVTAEIDVEGEGTKRVEGEAWFRVDDDARSIQWGSEGPNRYHGELQVTGEGRTSKVAVRLETKHDAADEIERDLAATVANVKRLVESGTA
jgi:carbon monoxide dehydrogenase subunit G